MSQKENSTPVNMLFVVANRASLAKTLHYLERHNYKLTVLTSLAEAAEKLQAFRPDVILISWNFNNAAVKTMYRYCTEKLKYLCFVFTEDNSPRNTSSLVRSRIPHTLFPPLSGPGVHRRVQGMLKKKQEPGPKHRIVSSNKFGGIQIFRVPAESVSPKTEWENVTEKLAPNAGTLADDQAWKGTALLGDEKEQIYFFKGAKKPEYDSKLKVWKNLSEGSVVLMQERAKSKEHSAVQKGIEVEKNVFSMIKPDPQSSGYNLSYASEDRSRRAKEKAYEFEAEEISKFLDAVPGSLPEEEDSGGRGQENNPLESVVFGGEASGPMGAEIPGEPVTDKAAVGAEIDGPGAPAIPEGGAQQELSEPGRRGPVIIETKAGGAGSAESGLESVLAQCATAALGSCTFNVVPAERELAMVSMMSAIIIYTTRFKGFLFCVSTGGLDGFFATQFL
jgi:hypothetical protein